MTELNENIKKHIKPFLSLKSDNKDNFNMQPASKTHIRSDGTKVTEMQESDGVTVTEIHKDGTVVVLNFDMKNTLRQDYSRRLNVEIVHHYDETSLMTDESMNVYDENNKLKIKVEKIYQYHDNKNKKSEIIIDSSKDLKTHINFDENGIMKEKIVQQGTVKTWYNADGKPVKRELDRGSGGKIIEDLTN